MQSLGVKETQNDGSSGHPYRVTAYICAHLPTDSHTFFGGTMHPIQTHLNYEQEGVANDPGWMGHCGEQSGICNR
jgi:hypothetical protein